MSKILPIYKKTKFYTIRYNTVKDKTFYYVQMKGESRSVTPYSKASEAIGWAEFKVKGKVER